MSWFLTSLMSLLDLCPVRTSRKAPCLSLWPHLSQHAGDSWLSLCPPWLHYGNQVLRTLFTDVHGSSLPLQCPAQIRALAWGDGPEQESLALVRTVIAPALPSPPPPNPPDSTCSTPKMAQLSLPVPQSSLPSLALERPQPRKPLP